MLENIANFEEILGVTLVLVTLVFLTVQIRQNTRAIRRATVGIDIAHGSAARALADLL